MRVYTRVHHVSRTTPRKTVAIIFNVLLIYILYIYIHIVYIHIYIYVYAPAICTILSILYYYTYSIYFLGSCKTGRFTRWVLLSFALVFFHVLPGFSLLRMRYAFLPPLLHHFWLRPYGVGKLGAKKEAFHLGSWSHWELWTQETPRALADWSWKGERFHTILAGGRSKSIAIATLDGQKRRRTSSILNFWMFVLDSLRKWQRSQMFKVAECCWLDGSKFG